MNIGSTIARLYNLNHYNYGALTAAETSANRLDNPRSIELLNETTKALEDFAGSLYQAVQVIDPLGKDKTISALVRLLKKDKSGLRSDILAFPGMSTDNLEKELADLAGQASEALNPGTRALGAVQSFAIRQELAHRQKQRLELSIGEHLDQILKAGSDINSPGTRYQTNIRLIVSQIDEIIESEKDENLVKRLVGHAVEALYQDGKDDELIDARIRLLGSSLHLSQSGVPLSEEHERENIIIRNIADRLNLRREGRSDTPHDAITVRVLRSSAKGSKLDGSDSDSITNAHKRNPNNREIVSSGDQADAETLIGDIHARLHRIFSLASVDDIGENTYAENASPQDMRLFIFDFMRLTEINSRIASRLFLDFTRNFANSHSRDISTKIAQLEARRELANRALYSGDETVQGAIGVMNMLSFLEWFENRSDNLERSSNVFVNSFTRNLEPALEYLKDKQKGALETSIEQQARLRTVTEGINLEELQKDIPSLKLNIDTGALDDNSGAVKSLLRTASGATRIRNTRKTKSERVKLAETFPKFTRTMSEAVERARQQYLEDAHEDVHSEAMVILDNPTVSGVFDALGTAQTFEPEDIVTLLIRVISLDDDDAKCIEDYLKAAKEFTREKDRKPAAALVLGLSLRIFKLFDTNNLKKASRSRQLARALVSNFLLHSQALLPLLGEASGKQSDSKSFNTVIYNYFSSLSLDQLKGWEAMLESAEKDAEFQKGLSDGFKKKDSEAINLSSQYGSLKHNIGEIIATKEASV